MDCYIGTKIVQAKPMEAHEFALRVKQPGVEVVIGADGHSQPGYVVVYEDGYTSWSPRETFERAYRRVTDAERALLA